MCLVLFGFCLLVGCARFWDATGQSVACGLGLCTVVCNGVLSVVTGDWDDSASVGPAVGCLE